MNTKGNTMLITGGTAGIGRALLHRFYSLGNQLIVSSSNAENLENLKLEFPNIETVVCDLAQEKEVYKLIEICQQRFSTINVLINNAGIQFNYDWKIEQEGLKKIKDEISVNFTSPMQLIYGLLPLLLQKPDAAIINVSSGLAFAPKKSAPVYCASKAAIHSVSKSLRYQLENTSIKVFEIIPPLVDTAMTAGRGTGKITAEQLVDEFMNNFKNNKFESNIGKTKLLRFIQRLSPKIADKIMKGGL
ncbi:short-chain dehydrogenase/reductase SDR [Emticicia oligotrophica DSM 17448]|uniref:Short-chain dehydrogenase/reductase SDR n=1 Tax=Emticicia oligotrophica (strain DSM 17448 / CIP 109782 / MTCC 6937 / GPTSA100-15) TaxID=929562 RepID=A0ABM5N1V5_EMTOG|nr:MULTISPECIES: SDR family NAD(P)-dependent oxidoreductase [Emticicia]AFK03309.1 short-chain dehydrogenase/reductase SDR [Emticicia oligotrophica DSM 17448]